MLLEIFLLKKFHILKISARNKIEKVFFSEDDYETYAVWPIVHSF